MINITTIIILTIPYLLLTSIPNPATSNTNLNTYNGNNIYNINYLNDISIIIIKKLIKNNHANINSKKN